jgi:2,4-dienoyl-CoA reductase-like NADH-dependent reductase (Old Yellow Enzyme family)
MRMTKDVALKAFEPGNIGNITIKNRLVRSATFEHAATDRGEVTDFLVELYRELAEGDVGLIITGHAAVHPRGFSNPKMMRILDDSYIAGMKKIVKAVREVGNDCKIVLQLNHAGRQQPRPELGEYAVAPSPVFDMLFQRTPRSLSQEEIGQVVECFAQAIRRAREAGFDGVELHAAHGWLLSSFLSPRTNRRDDGYGGTTEKRTKILRDIHTRARRLVGEDYPILVKINTEDYLPDGIDIEESKRVARILADTGFGAIETSGSMWETLTRTKEELGWEPLPIPESRTGIRKRAQEAYFWENARAIGKEVHVPLILVGGIRSLGKVEEILNEGSVDFCAMSRPFIREPDLPKRWMSRGGQRKAACTSCNACLPKSDRPLECRVAHRELAGGRHLLSMFPYFQQGRGPKASVAPAEAKYMGQGNPEPNKSF